MARSASPLGRCLNRLPARWQAWVRLRYGRGVAANSLTVRGVPIIQRLQKRSRGGSNGMDCSTMRIDVPEIGFMLRMASQSAAGYRMSLPGVVALPESGSTPGYYPVPHQGTRLAAVPKRFQVCIPSLRMWRRRRGRFNQLNYDLLWPGEEISHGRIFLTVAGL